MTNGRVTPPRPKNVVRIVAEMASRSHKYRSRFRISRPHDLGSRIFRRALTPVIGVVTPPGNRQKVVINSRCFIRSNNHSGLWLQGKFEFCSHRRAKCEAVLLMLFQNLRGKYTELGSTPVKMLNFGAWSILRF